MPKQQAAPKPNRNASAQPAPQKGGTSEDGISQEEGFLGGIFLSLKGNQPYPTTNTSKALLVVAQRGYLLP